mmetsp:Transcript_87105/g.177515  ORF Transcript_87105/g.177515 Transcript_87105/m.177515 type:complete len:284 (+) Transcript_87105:256-1107(+)
MPKTSQKRSRHKPQQRQQRQEEDFPRGTPTTTRTTTTIVFRTVFRADLLLLLLPPRGPRGDLEFLESRRRRAGLQRSEPMGCITLLPKKNTACCWKTTPASWSSSRCSPPGARPARHWNPDSGQSPTASVATATTATQRRPPRPFRSCGSTWPTPGTTGTLSGTSWGCGRCRRFSSMPETGNGSIPSRAGRPGSRPSSSRGWRDSSARTSIRPRERWCRRGKRNRRTRAEARRWQHHHHQQHQQRRCPQHPRQQQKPATTFFQGTRCGCWFCCAGWCDRGCKK